MLQFDGKVRLDALLRRKDHAFDRAGRRDAVAGNAFWDAMNYENVGGTPVLGVNAPVIIGHGISSFVRM